MSRRRSRSHPTKMDNGQGRGWRLVALACVLHAAPADAKKPLPRAGAHSGSGVRVASSVPARQVAALPPVPHFAPLVRDPHIEAQVEAQLRRMQTPEKIAQLMMIGFNGTEPTGQLAQWVRDRQVGGVALFSRNIVDLPQTLRLTHGILALAQGHVAPFVSLDQEGGTVIRVQKGASVFAGNMTLGATHSGPLAYLAGQAMAVDLRRLGFNMNLAPVLDVNSNPKNPVIGPRSLGERATEVARLGAWLVRGQQEAGIAAVAKHFPGHGDTQSDSHFSLPSVQAHWARLDKVELPPFRAAIAADVDAIMTAHIALPQVAEATPTPATVSRIILTEILRRRLNYDGVIMTDGLEMQGIAQRYGTGRAAVLAILAGADVPLVLWSEEGRLEVLHALQKAVAQKEISMARLDASVRRILRVKVRRGILDRRNIDKGEVLAGDNVNFWHESLLRRVAEDGITVVQNRKNVLPIRTDAPQQDAAAAPGRSFVVMAPSGAFAKRMARVKGAQVVYMPAVPSRGQRREIAEQAAHLAKDADVLVAAVVNRYHMDMVQRAAASRPDLSVVLVSLASPYLLQQMPRVDGYVCSYSATQQAQIAAANVVLGDAASVGRLPVSLPGSYPFGHGLLLPGPSAAE